MGNTTPESQSRTNANHQIQYPTDSEDGQPQQQSNQYKATLDNEISRQKIENYYKYPHSCLGKVISNFVNSKDSTLSQQIGIGSLLSPKLVITAAHLIYSDKLQQFADSVQFYPMTEYLDEFEVKKIKAIKFQLSEKYIKQMTHKIKIKYDWAFLILQESYVASKYLKMKFDYKIEDGEQQQSRCSIEICTFKSLQNEDKPTLFNETDEAIKIKNHRVYYDHFTQQSDAGSPILIKDNLNEYKIIGIHIGISRNHNFGILLSSVEKQIIQAKNMFYPQSSAQILQQILRLYSQEKKPPYKFTIQQQGDIGQIYLLPPSDQDHKLNKELKFEVKSECNFGELVSMYFQQGHGEQKKKGLLNILALRLVVNGKPVPLQKIKSKKIYDLAQQYNLKNIVEDSQHENQLVLVDEKDSTTSRLKTM